MSLLVVHPQWLEFAPVRGMMDTLTDGGIEIAFSGGAVRDALIDRTPKDFDIVTTASVDKVMYTLQAAGIHAWIKSERYKNIGAELHGVQFDILVRDYGYDSFEATVRHFAGDTDVTINALYYIPGKGIYDDFGGAADLHAGRVRFMDGIGSLSQRPPSTLLRFFRFYSCFGKPEADSYSLQLCALNASHAAHIQRSVMYREMRILLASPRRASAIRLMFESGVLQYILGFTVHLPHITQLGEIEKHAAIKVSWEAYVASLLLDAKDGAEKALEKLREHWELQAVDTERIAALLQYISAIEPGMDEAIINSWIEDSGQAFFNDLVMLRWLMEEDTDSVADLYLPMLRQ